MDLVDELIASVEARDSLSMQQKIDDLELAYKEEFSDSLGSFTMSSAHVVKTDLVFWRRLTHDTTTDRLNH